MYEYDPSEPSLGQAFANILRGVKSPQQWQEVGQGIQNTAQVIPNVAESLARGGVAQAIGTMGDLRDLRNTVQSYLPKSVQNWSNAAEFLTNPYAKALIQTAPTTEQTLEAVPRITPAYEGSGQHEVLGEFIAPSLGYFGGKALKMGKNLPVGMSIEDVTPPAKIAEALRQPEKNQLGFYSALDEAVTNLPNAKGTGQQYLAQLLKTGGVKQEELATRGLDTFLESNPKVTREQIAQYLRENPVKLEETVLKEGSPRNLDSMNVEEHELRGGDVIDDDDYINAVADDDYFQLKNDPDEIEHYRTKAFEDLGIDPHTDDFTEMNRVDELTDEYLRDAAYARARDMYYENPYRTYYDDLGYEVTGNDDVGYSITDPRGNPVSTGRSGIYDISDVESRIREDALDNGLLHFEDDEYGTKYHDYTLPNGENYREVLIQYPNKKQTKYGLDEKGEYTVENPEFTSSHFDEPNILAHLRTTDRTIDGKKTLFVEEIQSDWHQQGRKHGYAAPLSQERKMEIRLELDKLDREKNALREERSKQVDDKDAYEQLNYKLANLERQQVELRSELSPKGVPDAPFKKNWQELAMKRAMQMAAEGGYDRVAFTTGKQQNERYNLARYLDEVYYKKNDDGTYTVSAIDKQHRSHMGDSYTPDEIEQHLGKDMAKKIVEDQGKTIERSDSKSISGEGLQIGGEGMKGFYDKILPDFINKYGKKHGLKVGKTNLEGISKPTTQMIEDAFKQLGYTKEQVQQMPVSEKVKVVGKANEILDKLKPKGEEVHYFDLTPEAKESFLKKGQPMFAVAPALAITDEDSRREILEKLFNSKK